MAETEALPKNFETEVLTEEYIWECPEFKVSGAFSSGMVLQRDEVIKIWGFSKNTKSTVTGEFAGEIAKASVNENNKWVLAFRPQSASTAPQTMKIKDDCGHEVILEDILIGDVWVIGGQSNGELSLEPCLPYTEDISYNENDNFRLFAQFQHDIELHQELCNAPQPDIIKADWHWKRPGEKASKEFSAIGWFFAREVSAKTGIPIGVIMMCPAGACISELMPVSLAHECNYFKKTNVVVGGYYNTAIAPFIGIRFKGMIFFQGESESIFDDRCIKYSSELQKFVKDEREQFGFDFPFYNVQLSSYTKESVNGFKYVDYIRLEQYDAYKKMSDSSIVVDMDLGAPEGYFDWPHSPFKKELGRRLSTLALAKEYGIGNVENSASPEPISAVLADDKKSVKIRFRNIGGGLSVTGKGNDPFGCEITGFGFGLWEKRKSAKAFLTGRNEVTVVVPENADTSVVTYAYFNLVDENNANLVSGTGFPAISFSEKL